MPNLGAIASCGVMSGCLGGEYRQHMQSDISLHLRLQHYRHGFRMSTMHLQITIRRTFQSDTSVSVILWRSTGQSVLHQTVCFAAAQAASPVAWSTPHVQQ